MMNQGDGLLAIPFFNQVIFEQGASSQIYQFNGSALIMTNQYVVEIVFRTSL